MGVWMFCCNILGPVYDEDVLVWLKDDVVGAEVHVNYVRVSVGFSYVD